MTPQRLFRFWVTLSAFWIAAVLVLDGKIWRFPYPFQVAWELQQKLLKTHWD